MTSHLEPKDLPLTRGAMRFDAKRLLAPGDYVFDPMSPGITSVPVTAGGRQAAWFIDGDFGQAVLRRYHRGGLMAKVSTDRYIWTGEESTRSYSEFNLLCFMHASGLPVPRPLAAAYWRDGLTYKAAILVERIPDVRPLAHALEGGHVQVAAAIYAMHDAGVWHADLNAYNILIDGNGKVWLIDFDKGSRQVLSQERRRANLLRLRRSLIKVAKEPGLVWWNALQLAYAQLGKIKGHI